MRFTPRSADAKPPTRAATPDPTCRSLFQDLQGGDSGNPASGTVRPAVRTVAHPGQKQLVWSKEKRLRRPATSSPFSSLLAVLQGAILRFSTYTDKVQLFLVSKELQGVMATPSTWDPLVVTRRESKHLCLNFYSRTMLSSYQRQILRTHQESKSLDMELWDRPMYERPLTDDEPSDRDDTVP